MKKRSLTFSAIVGIALVVILFHVTVFSKNLSKIITENIYTQLSEISSQTIVTINAYLDDQLSTLSGMADQISQLEDLQGDAVYALLNSAYQSKSFLRLAVNFPDGSRITHDRQNDGNISDKPYFIKSIAGQTIIDGPSPSIVEPEKTVIILAVPIIRSGEIIASLSATFDIDSLDKLFNLSFFDGSGYMFIAKSDGTIITNVPKNPYLNKDDNFLDYMKAHSQSEEIPIETTEAVEGVAKNGHFTFNTMRERSYVSFMEIGVNDWYLLAFAPEHIMKAQVNSIEFEVISLGIVFAICIVVLVGFIIYTQLIIRNNAILSERCFHELAQQTGKVIFEWDFDKSKITTLNNFKEIFGREAKTVSSPIDAIESGMIYPDDVRIFYKIFTDISTGQNVDTTKFRIKNAKGEFLWCSISGVVIKDKKGNPYKAIGSLENIDKQERESEELREKASVDGLTGLLNKAAMVSAVSAILSSSCSRNTHAIISADIDHFKSINDSFGHLYGDKVLIEVAEMMKNLFRSTDIVGRFGGDEFVIFIRDIPNVEFIKDKITAHLSDFEKTYRVGDVEHKISVSLGVALYPQNGSTYEELYKKADIALYMAKQSGKNVCFLYDNPNTLIKL